MIILLNVIVILASCWHTESEYDQDE